MVRVAVACTVKVPLQQLIYFVNYHLHIGIDEIILFFDNPNDEGIEALAGYEQVTTIACSSEYWDSFETDRPKALHLRQIVNVNEGARIAQAKNYDWIIHIDSDELINPIENIKSVLKDCNADILRFSLLEAAPESEQVEHIFEPTLFRKKSNFTKIFALKLLVFSNVLFNNKYLRGHSESKVAFKISAKIKKYGNSWSTKKGSLCYFKKDK